MNVRRRARPAAAAAVFFLAASVVGAAERSQAAVTRESRFSLEIGTGIALIDPADFNLIASYEESYLQYNYVQRYATIQRANWSSYAVLFDRRGDQTFGALRSAVPVRFRLVYDLGPNTAVSLGVQYLGGRRTTNMRLASEISDLRRDQVDYPQSMTATYGNPEFVLAASAWAFQAGFHLKAPLGPRLRFEIALAGGLLLARCLHISEAHYFSTAEPSYSSERTARLEMRGTGSGPALDLGARLIYEAGRRLDLFAEIGFAYRVSESLRGSGQYRSQIRDSNTVRDSVVSAWEGSWNTILLRGSGGFSSRTSGNIYGGSEDAGPFTLDLSGFQFLAGLRVRL